VPHGCFLQRPLSPAMVLVVTPAPSSLVLRRWERCRGAAYFLVPSFDPHPPPPPHAPPSMSGREVRAPCGRPTPPPPPPHPPPPPPLLDLPVTTSGLGVAFPVCRRLHGSWAPSIPAVPDFANFGPGRPFDRGRGRLVSVLGLDRLRRKAVWCRFHSSRNGCQRPTRGPAPSMCRSLMSFRG